MSTCDNSKGGSSTYPGKLPPRGVRGSGSFCRRTFTRIHLTAFLQSFSASSPKPKNRKKINDETGMTQRKRKN